MGSALDDIRDISSFGFWMFALSQMLRPSKLKRSSESVSSGSPSEDVGRSKPSFVTSIESLS